MNTLAINPEKRTQKKLIDLPVEVCRGIAVYAAEMGMSAKKLIEKLVMDSYEDLDDNKVYAYLLEHDPDGSVMLTDEEQEAMLQRLREKAGEA